MTAAARVAAARCGGLRADCVERQAAPTRRSTCPRSPLTGRWPFGAAAPTPSDGAESVHHGRPHRFSWRLSPLSRLQRASTRSRSRPGHAGVKPRADVGAAARRDSEVERLQSNRTPPPPGGSGRDSVTRSIVSLQTDNGPRRPSPLITLNHCAIKRVATSKQHECAFQGVVRSNR